MLPSMQRIPDIVRSHPAVRRYGCIAVCTLAGSAAGIWGAAAGLASGLLLTQVVFRIEDERRWRRALEEGRMTGVAGEPFPGALYVCALAVCSGGDAAGSARLLRTVFGTDQRSDWNSLCRAAASAAGLNSDLLVECLAHIIRSRDDAFPADMLKKVFFVLTASELLRSAGQDAGRPSHYLAELLDYRYTNSSLAEAYAVLGLPPDAAVSQVKAAHRRLAARYHPDRAGASSSDSDAFMRVQAAYELILRQQ